jgi:uncharacterized membrane protein HdeD (DUF308 family)
LKQPLPNAEGLAQMLGAFFLVAGLFRIVTSLMENLPSWSCLLLNGVITLLLGIAMWRPRPAPNFRTLGVLVGIELIANGVTCAILSVGVRRGVARLARR